MIRELTYPELINYAKTQSRQRRYQIVKLAEEIHPNEFDKRDFIQYKYMLLTYPELVEKHGNCKNIIDRHTIKSVAKKLAEFKEEDFPKRSTGPKDRKRTYEENLSYYNELGKIKSRTPTQGVMRCRIKDRAKRHFPEKFNAEDWVDQRFSSSK